MALLKVENLRKSFWRGSARFAAVDEVGFAVERGETLALVGPSGSGKSTIARLVTRLLEPDSGSLTLEEQNLLQLDAASLRRLRSRLQIVFQDPAGAFNPRATVHRVLDDPLRIHTELNSAERRREIGRLLERVGLPPAWSARAVHEVSGGQAQRIAIARAIATRPALIVLDEAVSALDVSVRADILRLLRDLQEENGTAYLFITHDLGVVRAIAHRAAVLESGRIVETGPARTIVSSPQSAIGKALVAAAPRLIR